MSGGLSKSGVLSLFSHTRSPIRLRHYFAASLLALFLYLSLYALPMLSSYLVISLSSSIVSIELWVVTLGQM